MMKLLVVGVIVLFIGMTISSSTGLYLEKQSTIATLDGNTLYVGGSGSGNYSKIQDAIDNASDGDTVYVYNGTYVENLTVDKSINLIGENRNSTIIEWKERESFVVNLTANGILLKSLTIIGAGSGCGGVGISICSNYNVITDTGIMNNNKGIMCISSTFSHNIFTDNIIRDNSNGMILVESNHNKIARNYFYNHLAQISLCYSYYNNITKNIFSQEGSVYYGLHLIGSKYNTITDNSFLNCGISIAHSHGNKILNNTVNGKPLIYLKGKSNIVLDEEAGQVIIKDCFNITIRSQKLISVSVGITILKSPNCTLVDNTIKNSVEGIRIKYSDGSVIRNNDISSSDLSIVSFYCNNFLIDGNNIFNGNRGIFLGYCNNTLIKNNTIAEHRHWSSIELTTTRNSIITNNIIYNNTRGILLNYESENNRIFKNEIRKNSRYGICLSRGSNNNDISCNNFIRNHPNAYFIQKLNNSWDGNFWNRLRFLPKIIFGFKDENSIFPSMIRFDWHPASEPYDIGV